MSNFKHGKNSLTRLNKALQKAETDQPRSRESGTVFAMWVRLKNRVDDTCTYNFEEVVETEASRKNLAGRGAGEVVTEVNGRIDVRAGVVVRAMQSADDGKLYFTAATPAPPTDEYVTEDGEAMIVVTVPKNLTKQQKIPVIVNGKTILVNMPSGGGGGANLPAPEEGKLLRWKNGVLINDYDRLC